MSYSIEVHFDRELTDDIGIINTDNPRALVKQFVKELQEHYDNTGMAGLFQVKSITINGETTIINSTMET